MPRSEITPAGLKRDLLKKGYKNPLNSLVEYIWNGFDAGASVIQIDAEYNILGGITSISVSDNGTGISRPENFQPIFESIKVRNPETSRSSSSPRGINGLGRLTFFTLASHAIWETVYRNSEDELNYEYTISVGSSSLLNWESTPPVQSNKPTGTKVTFSVISPTFLDISDPSVSSYLKNEFAWFLELHKNRNLQIKIGDSSLEYSDIVLESDTSTYYIGEYNFKFRFILWTHKQNDEYSRYYLLDSNYQEKYTSTTTLNNKADNFFHSIYIESSFFDIIPDSFLHQKQEKNQPNLFQDQKEAKTLAKLLDSVEKYLHDKRKPFIAQASDNLIEEFERTGVFPSYRDDDEWEHYKKTNLFDLVKQIYRIEPRVFNKLNLDQKKIFVRFLDIIVSSGQKDQLFSVLKEVINLDSSDLTQLAKTLRTSKLSNVIKTIQLIEDRYRVINALKKLVFEKEQFKANESHIQKLVEDHYWIFGEKYHLVSAEEPDFEAALRGHAKLLTEKDEFEDDDLTIDHPDKKKQMDIFMCRQTRKEDSVHHIIVELKHPDVSIGRDQLEQVKRYFEVILSKDRFNASNFYWEFYLIGNKFDSRGYIKREIANAKEGNSIAYSVDNYKIYVKTWSEVINEFEIRHDFVQRKLQLERSKLIEEEGASADEIVENTSKLTSSLPGPIVETKKQKGKKLSS
jgi:Histidine kinase-, DNA gyrase B-, and HSP90-like ATPase